MLCGSLPAALLLWSSIIGLDDSPPTLPSSEPSLADTNAEVGSVENTVTDTQRAVAGERHWKSDSSANVDERRCDTMVREVRMIPYYRASDALVDELVSKLIDASRGATDWEIAGNLECAGRLAKKSKYFRNNDRVLARVIEENIRVGRCGAARELTNHLKYTGSKSKQKARVARACLGRD